MARTKARGGFANRPIGGGKKSFAKKRAGSDDEGDAPRASKRSKGDDDEEEVAPLVPKLEKDDDGNDFVSVSC
jgi:hypothetical protein